MSDARDMADATVWAAEHGASSPDLGLERLGGSGEQPADSAANVGHRFRIHGRLHDNDQEPVLIDQKGLKLDPEFLRQLLARESEVDLRDVQLVVEPQKIVVDGSVNDEGERQEIETLLGRIPGVRAVDNRLRIHST